MTLNHWPLKGVRFSRIGVYKNIAVLAHHGEDLSKVQNLQVFDHVSETCIAAPNLLLPVHETLVCYLGLFSGLKTLTIQVELHWYWEYWERPNPTELKGLTETWFRKFRAVDLKIVEVVEEEHNEDWPGTLMDMNFGLRDGDDEDLTLNENDSDDEGKNSGEPILIPEVIIEVVKDRGSKNTSYER